MCDLNEVKTSLPNSVKFGTVAWLTLIAADAFWLERYKFIELLLLLAIWVLVPLGVHLLTLGEGSWLSAVLGRILTPAAVLTTASFIPGPGMAAALLASSWLLVCFFLALDGFRRLNAFRGRSFTNFCFAAGEVYLLVAGAGLVISRLGLQPLGFQEPIVLLTSVHFHFAGFITAILAGHAYEKLLQTRWAPALRLGCTAVLLGPGLLAIGFLTSSRLKLVAVLLIVLGQFVLAAAMLRVASEQVGFLAKFLLFVSAGSVIGGMILAAVWAAGEYPLHPLVDLHQMAKYHGTLNAVGFGGCGLFAWAELPAKRLQA